MSIMQKKIHEKIEEEISLTALSDKPLMSFYLKSQERKFIELGSVQ